MVNQNHFVIPATVLEKFRFPRVLLDNFTMATNITMTSGPTITLGGGFSPISGMEFMGQSETKGGALYKCKRLFNVREIQKPGENFVITGSILKSTSVKETWNLRFDIDPDTRKVIKSWCSCYVGSTGICKHCGALYKYINSERSVGKTDQEQQWTTPSRKAQERFPKGETVQQMFGIQGSSVSKVVIQRDQPEFCETLKADLERFGLTNSSMFKSLSVVPVLTQEEDIEQHVMPRDLNIKIREIFCVGGMLNLPQRKNPQMTQDEETFFRKFVETDDEERELIFCKTIGQAQRDHSRTKWFDEKEFRVSASNARKIAFANRDETLYGYFFKDRGSAFESDSMRYGSDTEATAFEAYKSMREERGDVCTYMESGLVICRHYTWLCASPDGIVIESNGDLTIIEIKCPVSGASGDINVNYLKGDELNKKHYYYAQVQVQLMACDAKKTHFFIYAQPGQDGIRRSRLLTIYRDDKFI